MGQLTRNLVHKEKKILKRYIIHPMLEISRILSILRSFLGTAAGARAQSVPILVRGRGTSRRVYCNGKVSKKPITAALKALPAGNRKRQPAHGARTGQGCSVSIGADGGYTLLQGKSVMTS